MHAPLLILNEGVKREIGNKVHHANIHASKVHVQAVADIIRTTLGPRSMLKMLLDAAGGIVVTNDGNSILRELDVAHPAAKSMIELSRTQDEEVGDGTTSVIVLGVDLAAHYLSKAGVSAIRRLRKTDNNRIAKACGATVINRPEELQESDVGTGAGLFEVQKIGDEYFTFIVDCNDPKACTVLLRGASKDLLNEVERNLQDPMCVARNMIKNPKLVPEKWPYEAVAQAFEAIPRTLTQNCGVNVVRTMTALHAKHANGENVWIGIDGNTGEITDMKERGIWDAYNVKAQTFKTAIEAACMLLRIDDINDWLYSYNEQKINTGSYVELVCSPCS
ncbi:hypothetical protein SUGI_0016510 [Cryptomeria japonica]|nr:hypothetical protein SUGI_0016510 [Cryptomeria japonica]